MFFSPRSFLAAEQATAQQLAFVNAAGNAIIKVDNTTVVPAGADRDTIRITTTDSYAVGSVWIADMLHVPFGVGQRLSNRYMSVLSRFAQTIIFVFLRRARHRSRTQMSMTDVLTCRALSAPCGPHSGLTLLRRLGLQAARSTRSRALT